VYLIFITKYKSVSEASKLTGFNKTSIAKACRGMFVWSKLLDVCY